VECRPCPLGTAAAVQALETAEAEGECEGNLGIGPTGLGGMGSGGPGMDHGDGDGDGDGEVTGGGGRSGGSIGGGGGGGGTDGVFGPAYSGGGLSVGGGGGGSPEHGREGPHDAPVQPHRSEETWVMSCDCQIVIVYSIPAHAIYAKSPSADSDPHTLSTKPSTHAAVHCLLHCGYAPAYSGGFSGGEVSGGGGGDSVGGGGVSRPTYSHGLSGDGGGTVGGYTSGGLGFTSTSGEGPQGAHFGETGGGGSAGVHYEQTVSGVSSEFNGGNASPEEAIGGAPSAHHGLALFDSTHHHQGSQGGEPMQGQSKGSDLVDPTRTGWATPALTHRMTPPGDR
jgi:hypothetical protein